MSRSESRARRQPLGEWLAGQPPRHVLSAIGGLVALAAAVAGAVQGAGLAILILAAAALGAAIAAFWASLRTLFGERTMSPEEAYGLATPRAEDEQKRAVLRALNDLEHERTMGKLSEQDFAALRSRYRAQAQELLQLESQASKPLLERVERIIAAHLAEQELAPGSGEAADVEEEVFEGGQAPLQICPACETTNDGDAVFCKRCGRALEPAPPSNPSSER